MDRDTHLIWESLITEMGQWQSPRLHLDDPNILAAFQTLMVDYKQKNVQAPGGDLRSMHGSMLQVMMDMIDSGQVTNQTHQNVLSSLAHDQANPDKRQGLEASLLAFIREPEMHSQVGGQRPGDPLVGGAPGTPAPTKSPLSAPHQEPQLPNPRWTPPQDTQWPDTRREFPPNTPLS